MSKGQKYPAELCEYGSSTAFRITYVSCAEIKVQTKLPEQ